MFQPLNLFQVLDEADPQLVSLMVEAEDENLQSLLDELDNDEFERIVDVSRYLPIFDNAYIFEALN